ncbi:DHA2 family efflux MFS transporter permease subunit [Aestuariivirga sp.]|uniref:DHA2 family efflux MFS transporter permease subunit n=1 Tax=Aestuariivirga sp. TaxID=2650926 RepID=UPI0039E55583
MNSPGPSTALNMRHVVAFVAMVFGMFMAILDIQIVSASLSEIQAGLSASPDEIAWVQTSYLIAEVIMIPLSGTLSRILSTRVLYTISAGGFTLMSFLCAQADSISSMIVFRALQGFIGGAMIPTVFATSFLIFPREKQPVITPIIGLVATLAPTIGPTVGGYLTDLFSWHWLFLVNIVPGIVVTVAAWFLIDFDKPDWSLVKNFDWFGLIFMGVMLGSLEYILEEGPRDDWLDSTVISTLIVICIASALAFAWRIASAKQPIVDFSAFANRNFSAGSLFSFSLGVGLYGLTFLYPVYLARVRGYSSLMIGDTMFVTGIAMFLTAPIAGRLMTKIDPRLMMATGFAGFAVGTWIASAVTKDWSFNELLIPQILRGVSLMMCMIPITNMSLGTLPPAKLRGASGLFNLTRNLGGAVGLAIINTVINHRTDFHYERLAEHVTWSNPAALETLDGLTKSLSTLGSDASSAALAKLSQMVQREALVMAIGDVFVLLTVLFAAIAILTPLMRKPRPAPAGAGAGGH